ncbi:MAG: tetratricopeptide repeat protein [Bacteroidia bacterium]|nr:tetratricopeptide repeat protein [Bacteroidia bacterium]
MRHLLLCYIFLSSALSFSQNHSLIDSLQQILKTAGQDTVRVNAWNTIGYEYRRMSWDSTFQYASKALKLARKIKDRKGEALALNNIGISFHFRALYDSALSYYGRALKIRTEIKEMKGIASCHTNMGIIQYLKGNYDTAMGRHRKAFQIQKQLKDTNGLANTSNNMASVYRYQGNYEKALELFIQALHFYERSGDQAGRLYALNNIGIIYASLDQHEKAIATYKEGIVVAEKTSDNFILAVLYTNLGIELLDLKRTGEAIVYFEKGYRLAKEINTHQGMATCATNLGRAYLDMNQLPRAAAYVKEALTYYNKSGEKQGQVSAMNLLAQVYIAGKDRGSAEQLLNQSLKICKEVGLMDHLETVYFHLYTIAKERNDSKTALTWFKLHCHLKDSLLNSNNSNSITELQARFETEKKEKQILLLEKEQTLLGTQLEEQKSSLITTNITLLALGLLIALSALLVAVVIRTLKRRKKINEELTHLNISILSKKEVIEQHNEEIQRNLVLAGEIQAGILPRTDVLQKHLKEYFLLFQPKEAVSGDFYWVKEVTDGILAAVVDCTGHGVPGAYMSVMAYEFLEDICRKNNNLSPAGILNALNKRLFEQQKESSFSENPGLDIGIVLIRPGRKEIIYSGSRQPLWHLKQGSTELKEVKADKKFMGLHPDTNFSEILIKTESGDVLYLFSDGYADQIGEQSKKKMLAQVFREKIIQGAGELADMKWQEKLLAEFFEQWKGNREQVDDVTILGIRL